MNWKIALALSAVVAVGTAFAACGSDDCTSAQDHLTTCMANLSSSSSTSSSSSSGGVTMDCSGAYLCQSECINNASCDEINGNLPAYTSCLSKCQGR
jgi:hypothetical protein